MYDGHMWGGGWFMMIPWTILTIALLLWAVRAFQGRDNGNVSTTQKIDTPLDIVKKRYARGEITKEEFDRMKKDLVD